jgi:hypothetical protein
MARFALFGPSDTDRVQPAQIVLVREHFSVWGFLLPLPYCLWHGNWRFSALLFLLGGLTGLMPSFGLPAADITLLGFELLTGLYVGFAAADIRAAALERDGYAIIDVAIAPDEDQALLRYLDQQKAFVPPAPQSHTTNSAPMPATGPSPVLGLFPEAMR